MRLTVHLSEAKKIKEEVKTKDGVKIVTKTINTLSFSNIKEEDVPTILGQIERDEEAGKVSKYSLCGDGRFGNAKTKKKNKK